MAAYQQVTDFKHAKEKGTQKGLKNNKEQDTDLGGQGRQAWIWEDFQEGINESKIHLTKFSKDLKLV